MGLQYNNVIQVYQAPGRASVNPGLAEITFINNGTTDVLLNGSLLMIPTASISFDGKAGEEDITVYTFIFEATSNPVQSNRLVSISKYYFQ